MAPNSYERLSFLDSSFLLGESPTNHMHVASTALFEAGSLRKADGGIDIDRIRRYVASRLHKIPRYRQIIEWTPVEGYPVWVDDPHFNIHYHVRHISLPRPGDERQLKRLAAQIMSQQLDRSRPLWEMWIVEGLEGGDRFAMVSKIHHCMVDGVSSVDLLTVILSSEPIGGEEERKIEDRAQWTPRPGPTKMELFLGEARHRIAAPLEMARDIGRRIRSAAEDGAGLGSVWQASRAALGSGLRRASPTPLNQPIGSHRRFDWTSFELADVKQVKNRLGGSLNDIVLATTAGAVRRFLESRHVNPETTPFRVMAPVSVRAKHEKGTLGNRVSAWMVDLPIGERDPTKRLEKIRATTAALKTSNQAMGAELLTAAASWSPPTLLAVGARLMLRALPFNLVVTNVPGPQVHQYMLESKLLESYGLVPLTDYLGLGIVLFSYVGKLSWGFNADWDLLPDLHDFVLGTEASFQELREAARPQRVESESAPTLDPSKVVHQTATVLAPVPVGDVPEAMEEPKVAADAPAADAPAEAPAAMTEAPTEAAPAGPPPKKGAKAHKKKQHNRRT